LEPGKKKKKSQVHLRIGERGLRHRKWWKKTENRPNLSVKSLVALQKLLHLEAGAKKKRREKSPALNDDTLLERGRTIIRLL